MRIIIRAGIIILFLSNIFPYTKAFSQTIAEIASFEENIPTKTKKVYKDAGQNKNEIEVVFSGLFLFYKSFVSSQDAISCVFTPSCSEYALIAVKNQGILQGMANTFDRLMRCNGLSAENYQVAPNSYLLIDNVSVKKSK